MNIIEVMQKYFYRSTALKSAGSIREEHGHIVSLTKCLNFLKIIEVSELDENAGYHIISWYRNNTSNSNNSINKRISFLKRVLTQFDMKSSFHNVKRLKRDTEPYRMFQANEIKQIFSTIDLDLNSSTAKANTIIYTCLIYMLMDTGLRISELLDIKIRNIDFENRIIYLMHTKNGKKEQTFFSDFSASIIKKLVDLNYDNTFLFWNKMRNRRLNYHIDVKNYMKRLKTKVGFDKLHAHMFRKTYATLIYRNTKNIRLVQKLLRHSRTSTTEIYINESFDEVRADYTKAARVFAKIKD